MAKSLSMLLGSFSHSCILLIIIIVAIFVIATLIIAIIIIAILIIAIIIIAIFVIAILSIAIIIIAIIIIAIMFIAIMSIAIIIIMIIYAIIDLIKGSLPLMLSICQDFGLDSSSETDPCDKPRTNSPKSCKFAKFNIGICTQRR